MKRLLVLILIAGWPAALQARKACTALRGIDNGPGAGVQAIDLEIEQEILDVAHEALALWRRCDAYCADFPRFTIAEGSPAAITVRFEQDNPTSNVCGKFDGRTITVFETARDDDGERVRCRPLQLVLAHELGHVLGLRDARGVELCGSGIMALICSFNRTLRAVQRQDCRAAGRAVAERPPPGDGVPSVANRAGTSPHTSDATLSRRRPDVPAANE